MTHKKVENINSSLSVRECIRNETFSHLLSLSSALKLDLGNSLYTDVTQVGAWNMLAQLYM